ncbi:MAG: hypothetical protein ACJAZH_000769 [Roseivirga sp.]|jgi:hypothetical protein
MSLKLSLLTLALGLSLNGFSQTSQALSDSLKSQISLFINDQSSTHEKDYLNITNRELGGLEDEVFMWSDKFRLESIEEFENTLGYTTERKIYFNFYFYETEADRQYALKNWLDNFIEGKSIRASRPVRTYPYATPTIILINKQSIIICNYECKYFDEDNYDFWKKSLMRYFGNRRETMLIEIECGGPLEWTKNAPDPKVRGLF